MENKMKILILSIAILMILSTSACAHHKYNKHYKPVYIEHHHKHKLSDHRHFRPKYKPLKHRHKHYKHSRQHYYDFRPLFGGLWIVID